jgi:hypothetical protein
MASHYAAPVECVVTTRAALRTSPSAEAPEIRHIEAGDLFELLEDSLGWAWGYAGEERRVGYVRSDALASQ